MQFLKLRKSNQIIHIKSDLFNVVNLILQDDIENLKNYHLDTEILASIKNKLQSLLKKDCVCGMCIEVNKLNILPPEFDPIIEAIKEKLKKENF